MHCNIIQLIYAAFSVLSVTVLCSSLAGSSSERGQLVERVSGRGHFREGGYGRVILGEAG